MSGETESRPSGWTVDTLKEHVDRRFDDNDKALQAALVSQEKAVAAALAAAKEAVLKAEGAADKRFESVNEFRQQLSDQTNTFLSRPEYDAQHKALEDKVEVLTERMNQDKGGDLHMGKIYGAIAAVGAVIGIIILLANRVL